MLQDIDILVLVESWLNYLNSHNGFIFTGFNIVRRVMKKGL